ncbi:sushi, von Willebrand factor type A, EGF and pentraxin domain-containing protein 1-like [Lytechinus pictus]|uniref:sushi, von Willebrand factor type A, EGF and pentraxin domain-containing protein 1-like n=1 Tax=Lytechinus pictus TaxID=7653 RepID=UPI0030B9EBBE
MMNKGECIRLLLLLMILFALGNPTEDTTPPKYVEDKFAVCNEKSSTKNYGKFVVVKPKGKFWNTPKAKDEESEPAHVEEPYLPNEFGTGVHEYAYHARDSAPSPNINICKIRFEVQVKTCPVLSNPDNGFHDCPRITDYLVVGTTCRYFCKDGYNLQGASQLECHGTSSETSATVTWAPLPAPTCAYSEGPVLSGCESYQFFLPANESASAFIWTVPVASDNSGDELTISTPSFPRPGVHELEADHYSLPYSVTDNSGNVGTCSVYLIVSGYYLEGENHAMCQQRNPGSKLGEWSNPTPRCTEVRCDPAPSLENGYQTFGLCDTKYLSLCVYDCSEGYTIRNRILQCIGQAGTNSASWIAPGGDGPVCEAITCPPIPVPLNGGINGCPVQINVEYGSICTVFCDDGFKSTTGSDPVQRTCDKDEDNVGFWREGGTLTCVVVTCLPLSDPVNGEIVSCTTDGSSTNISHIQEYNTVCRSSCNLGYTPQYSVTRRCGNDGSWDGVEQLCEDETSPEISCPSDRILFAEFNQLEATFEASLWEPVLATDAGNTLTAYLYSVNSDIVTGSIPTSLVEGEHTIEYRAADVAGNHASCTFNVDVKVTRCPPLYAPTNGEISLSSGSGGCTSGAIYGSECQVSCLDGYVLSEDTSDDLLPVFVCNRSSSPSTVGMWSGQPQSCNKIECNIPSVPNGSVSGCPFSAVYGDSCYFMCNDGFKSSQGRKSITRVCQVNGSFDGEDLICDVEISCPTLIEPEDGSVLPTTCTQSGGVPYNTHCSFSCNHGYLQNGVYSKTCLSTEMWSDVREVTCTDNEAPVFSSPCPLDHHYNADRGQSYANIPDIGDLAPDATDNSGAFTLTLNSTIPEDNNFPENPTRLVYMAVDSNGNLAVCHVIVHVTVFRCPRLQAPFHGSVTNCPVSPVYGSECSYLCNEGYELEGSEARTCELRGDHGSAGWTGDEPICQAKTCPALMTPENGVKSGCINNPPSTEVFGTQCIFDCVFGFEGIGGRNPICQADGTWTSNNFSCIAASCPPLEIPDGSSVTPEKCTTDPVFGQSCVISCTQEGYQLSPPNYSLLSCQANGQWTPGNTMATSCTDIQSPTFSECPQYLTFSPARGETLANVTWTVSATDNSGDGPTITCDKEQGPMGEGDSRVTCTASDSAGNNRMCTFDIEVEIHRCRPYWLPQFAEFVGDCDTIWGTECSLACSSGYQLIGSSTVTCESDGSEASWIVQTAPRCEVIQCDPLELPENVDINPPLCAGPEPISAGQTCTPYCPSGRELQGNGLPIVCEDDGQWNRSVEGLACTDTTAPILTTCPSPITLTRTEAWGVTANFPPPTATDSVDGTDLNVTTSPSDLVSPYNVTGDTTFIYTFSDVAGNSIQCSFSIYVQDELYPVLDYCPSDFEVNTTTQLTEVIWDPPIFSEPTGDPLEISCNYENNMATLAIDKDHLVECTATNLDNSKTTTCSFVISVKRKPCLSLDAPTNGALACDGFSGGTFCSIYCNDQFDIPRSRLQIPERYVCGITGQWTPHDSVPDCTETINGNQIKLPSEVHYYSGSCGTAETNNEIATAFLEAFQSSSFSSICTENAECSVDNIQVTCGPSSEVGRRRKRDVGRREYGYAEAPLKKIEKRQISLDYVFTVTCTIGHKLTVPEGQDSFNAVLDTEESLMDVFETLVSNGDLDLNVTTVDGIQLDLDESSVSFEYSELVCDPPYTANNDDYLCVPCGRGFYYDNETQECLQCEVGAYQDAHAQFTCQQCPEGQSTLGIGSKNLTQCRDICQPGQSSDSGLAPCYLCKIGSYQEEFYSTECVTCPNGMSTESKGSQSSLDCIEYCRAGEYSPSGFVPCTPCPNGTYQSGTQRSQCHECPSETTTLQTGSTDASMCVDIDECGSSPCQHGASCVDGINSFTCICTEGYRGQLCEDPILWCDSGPCLNGGTCVDESDQFSCTCALGYTGNVCETEIDNCDPPPCANGGTCRSSIGEFDCSCPFGFGGETCSDEIDYCLNNQCENNGSCIVSELALGGYSCQCNAGYTGSTCSINIDECKSSPCLHGGDCIDGINSFTCTCTTGFTGLECETDIDLCADWNCQNGGTCKDLGDSVICACDEAYAGQHCEEVRTACSDSPCRNGGTCSAVDNTTLAYQCSCTEGYIGQRCETKVNYCQPDPCRNGATCEDESVNYICHCPVGYQGETCSEVIRRCDDTPCGLNATCIEQTDSFACLCDVGYTGPRCEDVLTFCDAQNPCLNGATCSGDSDTYECQCPPAYYGTLCEHLNDPCANSPCLNGGSCVKDQLSYQCDCVQGFEGIHCEVDQDECNSNPCEQGSCTDGPGSFKCECVAGYSGVTCSEDVLCSPNPCENGGNCENLKVKYRCECASGFSGTTCGRQIDYCRKRPCVRQNTEHCENLVGSYLCTCKTGFSGSRCETEIDECAESPSPCLNDGSCINQWGSFTCQCQPGFTGDRCDVNIDDCVNRNCENGGTCIDGTNSYSCQCTQGSYGSHCQLKSTLCDNDPCHNGGVCILNEDGFHCECLSGFNGETCEYNIDDCENHLCAHGSTCQDQWNSYRCICPLGITGKLCDQEIDDCLLNRCQHGSTCIDGRSSFTCICASGFTGKMCEIDILECSSSPCHNFGECLEGTDRFDCQCPEGYHGTTCEELVSYCVSSPCKNNGTCTDAFRTYICTCPPGYTGDKCGTVIPDNYDLKLDHQTSSTLFSADVSTDSENVTVSLWATAEITSSHSRLLSFGLETLRFGIYNPCNVMFIEATRNHSSDGLSICDGRWHHLLLVFIRTGRWLVLFDGSEVMSGGGDVSQHSLSGKLQLDVGANELDEEDSIFITGINVWSGYIPEDVLTRIKSECLPQLYGNIISWTNFDSHQDFPTTAVTPSVCDDTDECEDLNPCLNGATCVDKLRSYTCTCLIDYTGVNCERFIELCNTDSCEHGGTCTTMNGTIHCSCPDRYLGELCEHEIIDGGWSDWLPWSTCSASCEGGTRNSSRECTNPPPNEYGQPCTGESAKEEICNVQDCPGCLHLQNPLNGSVSCWSKGETRQCTVQCDSPDLGFVQPPLELYSCGPETDYKWDHEDDDNRRAILPACRETIPPVSSNAHADLLYPSATCASQAEEENIREIAGSNILDNIRASGCKNCAVSNLKVKNCGLSRKRSVVTSPITVSVVMDLNNITEDESLVEFGSNLEQRLQNGSFAMEVDGQVIEADVNRSGGVAIITCPFGTGLTLEGRCVVCPAGTYHYVLPNTTEAVCGYCPLHTYQNQDGQGNCIPCPSGLITNDPGADDIHFCIEPCPIGHYQDVWADSNETVCIQCPYDSYQNKTGKESCVPCPDKYVTREQGSTSSSDCVALCNAGHYVDLSNETNPQCPPCPLNTFIDLDLHQEQECSPCPQGMITTQNGSSQSTDCLVVCWPGTYLESSTCVPCPLNTYQDQISHRGGSCINCTGDLVTFHEGSENQQDCEEEPDETEVSKGRHVAIILGSLASVVVVIILVVTVVYWVKKMQQRMKVGDESVEMEKVEATRAVRRNNYTTDMSE